MLFSGIIGFFVSKFIPAYYKTLFQFGALALFSAGLFMSGAISDNEAWLARVREMETKVAQAEAESAKENVKIVEKTVKKIEVIKQKGDDVIRYVDREVVKYDTQCVIPKEFVKAHNDAAKAPK